MLAADSAFCLSRTTGFGLIAAGVLGPTLYSLAMGALLAPSDPYAASSSLAVLALCVGLYVLFGNLESFASGGGVVRRVIGFLGANSMAVYIFHAPLSAPIRSYLSTIPHTLHVAIGMCFVFEAVFASALFGAWLSRAKWGKWILSI